MQQRVRGAAAGLLVALLAFSSQAQETAPPRLTQGTDAIEVPGAGRVAVVFLFAAALAVGAAFVVRRMLPKWSGGLMTDGSIEVVGRIAPANGVRVHLLQVDGQRVLLAENRSALALVVLQDAKESTVP